MAEITEEMLTAAARAMWDYQYEDGHWDEVGHATGENAEHCRKVAERAISAALPHIERAVRTQVAAEISAVERLDNGCCAWGPDTYAAIARGDGT